MWTYHNPAKPYRLVSFVPMPFVEELKNPITQCSVGIRDFSTVNAMLEAALQMRLDCPSLYTTRSFKLENGRWVRIQHLS